MRKRRKSQDLFDMVSRMGGSGTTSTTGDIADNNSFRKTRHSSFTEKAEAGCRSTLKRASTRAFKRSDMHSSIRDSTKTAMTEKDLDFLQAMMPGLAVRARLHTENPRSPAHFRSGARSAPTLACVRRLCRRAKSSTARTST